MARLTALQVLQLRNLGRVDLHLQPGINLFVGANGAGKTALLEAVHMLARGRSFRSAQASKVIQHGEEHLVVRADVVSDRSGACAQLAVQRPRRGPVLAKLNGEKAANIADLAQHLPLQVMLPNVSDLVFAGPAERRSWLDWGVFHVEHGHLSNARRYSTTLKQRNALLKNLDGRTDDAQLDAFTEQLVAAAAPVAESRARYFAALEPVILGLARAIDPALSETTFDLRLNGTKATDSLGNLLSESRPRDVKLGVTHYGPHRCEIVPLIDGRTASERLSRGQGKSLALAMKIAQATVLRDRAQESTLFLMDDAGAELDRERNRAIFETLQHLNAQVLATSTDEQLQEHGALPEASAVFHVKHGRVDPA